MPVQRSIMKNRELLLSDRHSRCRIFSAAASVIVIMITAAAVFGSSLSPAAADVICGDRQENDTVPEEISGESRNQKTPEHCRLILEDPCEKTRYAEYEMSVGDCFSITFIHSVNKSPVIDYFEIREDGIYGVKTAYYGYGAGVPTELEEGQTLTYGEDGSMIISGFDLKMDSLIYRVGTVSDHILTLKDENGISLRDLCGRNARVGFCLEISGENE